MRQSLGPHIYYGLAFPFASFPDIICCLSSSSTNNRTTGQLGRSLRTLPFPDDFPVDSLSAEVVRPPHVPEGIWTAIVVTKRSHVDGMGQPMGHVRYKERVLEALGYKTVIIPNTAIRVYSERRMSALYVVNEISKRFDREDEGGWRKEA
jgi:hypothetical protein